MIKANELRIGNWVLNYFKEPLQINSGSQIDLFLEGYFPIPLSPEILEQCGFEKGGSSFTKDWAFVFLPGSPQSKHAFGIKGKGIIATIKYLHQLQNLYFALTGEELQVNIHDKTQTI